MKKENNITFPKWQWPALIKFIKKHGQHKDSSLFLVIPQKVLWRIKKINKK